MKKDGKGATITYDQFVKRLIDFGLKRMVSVIIFTQITTYRKQHRYTTDSFDAATGDGSYFNASECRSAGVDSDDAGGFVHHRFANLHVHDKNIQGKNSSW